MAEPKTYALLGATRQVSGRQLRALRECLEKLPRGTTLLVLDDIGVAEAGFWLATALGIAVRVVAAEELLDGCGVLIACPSGVEHGGSPTWQGVRRARGLGLKIRIVGLDGAIVKEGPG